MIKTETITIRGRQMARTYSDAGMMIERDGVRYSEAVDPIGSGRTYTETDEPVIFNTPAMGPLSTEEADWEAVSFNAQKWRTSLGAYGFSRCAALRHAGGAWTNYTVGDEYIS